MNYIVNVSKIENTPRYYGKPMYVFLFAAHTTYGNAYETLCRIKVAFPSPQFKVEISREECTLHSLTADEITELPRCAESVECK